MQDIKVILQPERSKKGQEIYVFSMEKSSPDKKRIFVYVKEGIIADMGAGAGAITEELNKSFPRSKILAVDLSPDMIGRLETRFSANKNIEVIKADIANFNYPEKLDTIIFISALHEVFSTRYSHEDVINTLENAFESLGRGGRLIIRDGVQPEQETLYVKPIHQESFEKSLKFFDSFKVRPMVINQGRFKGDSFIQSKAENFSDFNGKDMLFEMHSQDVSELLSKYFYSQENWSVELAEQFGIWSLREYQSMLIDVGFVISHAETYVLDYLMENHYSKDFQLFKLNDHGLVVPADYPPSTMILVAEKP